VDVLEVDALEVDALDDVLMVLVAGPPVPPHLSPWVHSLQTVLLDDEVAWVADPSHSSGQLFGLQWICEKEKKKK